MPCAQCKIDVPRVSLQYEHTATRYVHANATWCTQPLDACTQPWCVHCHRRLGSQLRLHSTCGIDMMLSAIMKSERHVELACRLTQFHELQHRCWIFIAQLPNRFGQEHVIRVVAPWHIAQALRGVADDGLGLRLAAAPVSCAERIPVHCCITCACSQLSWGTLHSG